MSCPHGNCNQGRLCDCDPVLATPEECESGALIAIAAVVILCLAVLAIAGPALWACLVSSL